MSVKAVTKNLVVVLSKPGKRDAVQKRQNHDTPEQPLETYSVGPYKSKNIPDTHCDVK